MGLLCVRFLGNGASATPQFPLHAPGELRESRRREANDPALGLVELSVWDLRGRGEGRESG
ncbi:MAG: hypothetical protein M3Y07_13000 [Acidobacteriota bacterium]|nr:hypothetical protein [Acidobacteriota bacterium]